MNKNQPATSNIVNVLKDFKDMVELRKYTEAQAVVISQLQERLSDSERENRSLRKSLDQYNGSFQIDVTPEEIIVIEQIDYLQKASAQRALTIEEVKKLDLLIKNLNLIKSQPTQIVANAKDKHQSLPEADLIEIASISEQSDT